MAYIGFIRSSDNDHSHFQLINIFVELHSCCQSQKGFLFYDECHQFYSTDSLDIIYASRYLHEVCSPSLLHKNIKSSNILLDTELNPHLSDCGLATFHQVTISKNMLYPLILIMVCIIFDLNSNSTCIYQLYPKLVCILEVTARSAKGVGCDLNQTCLARSCAAL